jgi:hypothetical protein
MASYQQLSIINISEVQDSIVLGVQASLRIIIDRQAEQHDHLVLYSFDLRFMSLKCDLGHT